MTYNYNLLFDIYIPIGAGSFMLIAILLRFIQLNSSARHHQSKINTPLAIRIAFIFMLIACKISMCFLTLYDDNYCLYGSRLGAFFSFSATVYTAQIGMIVYEYEKNVPFMWLHKAYWLLNILINLGEITFIIYDYIDEQFDATSDGNLTLEESILEFLNFFLLLCLVIYSLFIRKQDIYDFEQTNFFTVSIPDLSSQQGLLPQSRNQTFILEPIGLIRVKISKEWKVQYDINGEWHLLLKLVVNICDQTYKLNKSLEDFIRLENELIQESEKGLFSLPFKIPEDFFRMRESDLVGKVQLLQNYLSTLTQKVEYYVNPLLDFLQVQQPYRSNLEQERQRLWQHQTVHTQDDNMSQELFRSDSSKRKKVDEIEIYEIQSTPSNYVTYFDVKILSTQKVEDHVEYNIQIRLTDDSQTWNISKRFNEFKNLDDEMKSTLKVIKLLLTYSFQNQKFPPLPKKKLKFQLDEKEMKLRQEGLETYLKTLLNEKIYFAQPLFNFVEFDAFKVNQFKITDTDVSGFRVIPIGAAEVLEEKTSYTVYKFKIEMPIDIGDYIQFRVIQKRYTDFEILHDALKIHYSQQKVHIPELPPKFSALGIWTTVSFREKEFTNYLNALFKLPSILDCYHFKKFIQWQKRSLIQVPKMNVKIDSMNLIEQNIERRTSELINSLMEKDEINSEKLENLNEIYQKFNDPKDITRYNQFVQLT